MSQTHTLSIFFPCYNDAGTIGSLVAAADIVAAEDTEDYEIIVVDDRSTDQSRVLLEGLQKRYARLRLVFHEKNRGYGAVLRSGFFHSKKELIFYTDGDGQYDVFELRKLLSVMNDGVDVANGYKVSRADPFYRLLVGWSYNVLNKILFRIRLRDIDCDFRLIRQKLLWRLQLTADGGEICVEMVKQWEQLGARVAEVPVSHYHRVLGRSQFFQPARLVLALGGLIRLWWRLK